ncbi:MAG TPA: type II secretion system F family protein [Methylomirabilota bacterium]|jgi:type IV pilus assembly protein PilC|nr:type II secretion system F family protein [Methylomirabilota bacterium]
MPVFEYEVADRRGTVVRGRAEAQEQADLIIRFREQGQTVLALKPAAGGAMGAGMSMGPILEGFRLSFKRFSTGVKIGTLVLFTGQMAAMLGGGLHLVRILTALAAEAANKNFRKALEEIRDSITSGSTFADSLGRHPHIFNSLYVSVVRAGEVSGSLPVVLDTLTTYLEKADTLRRKIKGAITYPAVILTVAILIVIIMILKIVPVFQGVYAKANAMLPLPTRILIGISDAFRDYFLLVFLGFVFTLTVLFAFAQTNVGNHFFAKVRLRMPIFGPLIRKAIMARTCRTLSVLLNAGIPLMEAMETVSRVVGNVIIEEALAAATQRMRDGGTIAETLRQTGHFPGMVTQLVSTGEESGTLPSMLAKAAEYYEQQVDQTVATLSTLIEPLMIVIMGGIAGSIIFALYMPIFMLGKALQGQAH